MPKSKPTVFVGRLESWYLGLKFLWVQPVIIFSLKLAKYQIIP